MLTATVFNSCEGKLAEDKRVEEMRAAARARREAKEEEKLKHEQPQELASHSEKSSSSSRGTANIYDLAELDRKMAQGLKLSHKGRS